MPGKPYSAAEKAAFAKSGAKGKGSLKAQLRHKIVSLYSKAKKGV